MSYNCYIPTNIMFGTGRLNDLYTQNMPGKKAMIVISNGKSVHVNGSLVRTEEQLKKAGVEYAVYDKIQANPLKDTVMEGAAAVRDNGCDFIVALGGGSVMDASKGIALSATNEGDLWDYMFGGTGKGIPAQNAPLPIIAITTTAGTGSEVDCAGVITNPDTQEKMGLVHGGLFPVIAIVDPELMKTVPSKFTAYQGFDALFHSTEVYISTAANLMSDMVASTAITNIGKYLPRAVKDGTDLEAREHVAFANTMSGYSMMTGCCTSEHSMEHAMSAFHQNLPHGAGLIMISKEYYTYFINKRVCDDRFIQMAKFLGREEANDPMDFITALVELQEACGVADLKMSEYGITRDELNEMAENARETMGRLFLADPVPMNHEDCVEIYRKSYR
ncbi:MAG TPA: iron-containing alcohol dehydrogenase [Thermotogota bacterium]|nr:iron-containing alcohol dehydrogenase [Thermotogota bacterium]HPJ88844.1 iron-containing alcohol dehydrogenase [Thermotogota bacterium]HPR97633.1 iron-containing alcohol dehydrogenase [Thermotogota bacterium]